LLIEARVCEQLDLSRPLVTTNWSVTRDRNLQV